MAPAPTAGQALEPEQGPGVVAVITRSDLPRGGAGRRVSRTVHRNRSGASGRAGGVRVLAVSFHSTIDSLKLIIHSDVWRRFGSPSSPPRTVPPTTPGDSLELCRAHSALWRDADAPARTRRGTVHQVPPPSDRHHLRRQLLGRLRLGRHRRGPADPGHHDGPVRRVVRAARRLRADRTLPGKRPARQRG